MKTDEPAELSAEERRQIAEWISANRDSFPDPVRAFLELHEKYLSREGDVRRSFDSAFRELRRALRITPSSEKRPSGAPLAGLPREPGAARAKTARERLEDRLARSLRLGDWHRDLDARHHGHAEDLQERLAKMPIESNDDSARRITDDIPVEQYPLTEEQRADARAYGERFGQHLTLGDGAVDPALRSVNETLMPGGTVLAGEDRVSLAADVPAELASATVVKTMTEPRVRYDFSVAVTRIELDVEKKVVVDADGERHVLSGSTREVGPPRFSVTWSALATLAVMVAQFAVPFHRLATMLSTPVKRFTTGSLSRMLHYIAERLVPIYLHLAKELAHAEILAGDDTSCRVLDVSRYLARSKADPSSMAEDEPPWADYRTPAAADQSVRRCEERRSERRRRRSEGDRDARPTPDETPSLGAVIGRRFAFESPRRNGEGPKASMNTTVISGRSLADDPRSLIVFYRSHLGSCGNLFESLLRHRDPNQKRVTLQGDLSSTNLVTAPDLLARFKIRQVGCTAHARRPFANYGHEDPVHCPRLLHLFLGLAIHEQRLDVHGRNPQNVLAVRQAESREIWEKILQISKKLVHKWSPSTKLGTGARYIVKHFDKLTAYLDDPRLEPTNNLRERMLRTEKLIEGSSMFRRSLEGRFVLDIVRTLLQTAVAADVPVHEYLLSVLRADEDEVARQPERFTPRAWAESNSKRAPSTPTAP